MSDRFEGHFADLVEEFGGGGVHCYDVLGEEKRFGQHDVRGAAAARAVGFHHPVCVHDVQGGFFVQGADIGDALLEVVRMEVFPVPDDAHVVLHRDGQVGSSVVFQDGAVEPHVGIEQRGVDFGLLEVFPMGEGYFAVVRFGVGGDHFGTGGFGGFFDAAALVALAPVVAGMVEDRYFRSTSGEALADEFGDQFRVGISGQLRGLVPADVGFYQHLLAFLYEASDAADLRQGAAEHLVGFSAHDGDQVGRRAVRGGFYRLSQDVHRSVRAQGHGCTGNGYGFEEISSVHRVVFFKGETSDLLQGFQYGISSQDLYGDTGQADVQVLQGGGEAAGQPPFGQRTNDLVSGDGCQDGPK